MSAAEAEGPHPPGTAPQSRPPASRRFARWFGILVGGLALTLLVPLTGTLLFVLNPPSDLLRSAALPLARELLKHPRIQIGSLTLLPGSRLELRDVLLGPPKGYKRPLLRLGSLVLRYDLSRVHRGEVTIRQIQLDRPVVHLEMRGGKANWQTFLAALSSNEPEPEPEKSTGAPDIKVRLDRLSIIGFAAALDDGARRVVLDSLNLAVDGFYSPDASDLRLRLTLEPRSKEKPSLILKQAKPRAMEAELDAQLDLDLRLKDLFRGPKAVLDLSIDIASRKLLTPEKLEPVSLALRLDAEADLAANQLKVKRLDLSLGQEQLIGLEGTVTSLTGARELDLLLRRLRLPLDRLNPYVRSFLPGVELGGLVELRDLRLRSNQAELEALTSPAAGAAPTLPRLSGLLRLSRVKATFSRESIAGMALGVGDLDIDLALTAGGAAPATPEKILEGTPDPSTPPDPSSLKVKGAPVALLGRLSLGSFKGAGARVRGLGLLISAGIGLDGGLQPGPAAARVALTIPSLKYTSQATGRLAMSVRASAAGWAQLRQRRAKLSYLDLDVSKLLRARLVADLKQWGKGSLNADLKLQPLDLARLLAWLPPKLRSPLGGARLAGAIDLQAGLSGRLPGSGPVRPLDLPLNITLNLGMKGVKLADKGREISAGPLDGAITVKGKPGDLDLSGKLALASLTKPDQSLTLTGLTLEPRVRLTRRKLDARLAVGLERAAKTDLGFSASSLHLDHHVTAALPMAKLLAGRAAPLGKTRAEATLKLAKQRMAMPANTLSLEGMEIRLTAGYAPSGGGTSTIRLETDLARVAHEEQDLLVSGLKLVFDDEITGHGGISLPSPRPHLAGLASRHGGTLSVASMRHGRSGATASGLKLKMSGDLSGFSLAGEKIEMDWVQHSVGAELASLALRGVVDRPLLNNRFDLELTMHKLKDLELGKLALRLPTRGVYLDMSGRGEDLIPLDTTRLPDFSLKLAAGLKNRAAKSEAESTFLYPGVRGAGKLGAELSLVSSGGDRLRLDGRLLADAFNLWQRGGVKGRSSRIELRGLNARMPFSQQLILRGGRFRLPRPERLLTAMSARSPLYHELRPYTRRAAGLTLGGLLFERQGARGTQRIRLDRAHLDLTLADNTLMMKRLYLKLFGGDIAGALQVQLLSLAPLDLTLQFKTQVTGVDLAYLNPEAIRFGQETEVSALLDFSYRPAREELAGRMEITKLSLKMLDSLLVYLDPDRTNESVQKNRRLLSAWYIRWINPSVQLVSLWIKHGNLNMDINMDAWFVVGTVLKRVLKNMRVRRLNVLPMLRQEVTPILRKLERSLGAKKVAEK